MLNICKYYNKNQPKSIFFPIVTNHSKLKDMIIKCIKTFFTLVIIEGRNY